MECLNNAVLGVSWTEMGHFPTNNREVTLILKQDIAQSGATIQDLTK